MSLGIDDVAGAAFEARVQIKFTIMTTQMDSVMGHAAREIGSPTSTSTPTPTPRRCRREK